MFDGCPHTPLIFAHRGASGNYQENSFEAFDNAIIQGADGLETDAWALADNEIVLFHDAFLKTHSGESLNISKMTLPEIQKYTLPNGQSIPTLRDFIARYSKKKAKSGYPLLFSIDLQNFKASNLIPQLSWDSNLMSRILMCGTAISPLIRVRKLVPEAFLVFSNQVGPMDIEGFCQDPKVQSLKLFAFNVERKYFDLQTSQILQRYGLKTFVWDVQFQDHFQDIFSYSPYAIYTNFPDLAVKIRTELNRS